MLVMSVVFHCAPLAHSHHFHQLQNAREGKKKLVKRNGISLTSPISPTAPGPMPRPSLLADH